MIMRIISIILMGLLLQGCSTGYSNKFSCNPATGLGCTDMSSIDAMVDNGTLDEHIASKSTKGRKHPQQSGIIKLYKNKVGINKNDIIDSDAIHSREYENLRTKEQVARVWLNSYIEDDVYSGAKYIYMVLKQPKWAVKI